MAQFLGDIAFLLELSLIAAGLILLHVGRERPARLMRAARWILAVGATGTALCTAYFWLRYHQGGDFDRATVSSCVVQRSARPESLGLAWPAE